MKGGCLFALIPETKSLMREHCWQNLGQLSCETGHKYISETLLPYGLDQVNHLLTSEGVDPIELDEDVKQLTGSARFVSRTYRLFKVSELEDNCEDYGQSAVYKGTLEHNADLFILDDHHYFEKGRAERVCGNTADMLNLSRFSPHFEIIGDKEKHFGAFTCSETLAALQYKDDSQGGPCC